MRIGAMDSSRIPMQLIRQIILLVLSRCRNTLLLPFEHPVRANFRIQVDIEFILTKYWMVRLLLGDSLFDGESLFL
ncbi:Uncharacterised protein [Klebsiella michiganensis]|nr:Uncharacterised protein [Klebsiella michiganensis]